MADDGVSRETDKTDAVDMAPLVQKSQLTCSKEGGQMFGLGRLDFARWTLQPSEDRVFEQNRVEKLHGGPLRKEARIANAPIVHEGITEGFLG